MKKKLLLIIASVQVLCLTAQKLVPGDKEALLVGKVTNFKGKPLVNEIILLVNEKTKAVVKVTTGEGGKFEALVPVNATYALKYKNFTTDMDYTKMEIPPDKQATYEVEIKIDPPREIVLDNVYFDTGRSSLKPSSHKALNDLVEILKLKKTMVVEIQGHTDNAGSEQSNQELSQARAEEVKKYLVARGVPAERIVATGYGQSRPVADNATEAGRSKNRRTGLKVIKE
jgi:outer membrane protein OmpA-like peptidoglycan-associated protein